MAATDCFCDHCGYDLGGHGPAGECPECGERFDKKLGQGVRRSNRASPAFGEAPRWVPLAFFAIAIVLALACGGVFSFLTDRLRPLAIMSVIAVVLLLAAIATVMRDRNPL